MRGPGLRTWASIAPVSGLDANRVGGHHERARHADEIERIACRELRRDEIDDVTAMRTGRDRARERDAFRARVCGKDERVVATITQWMLARAFMPFVERVVALIGHVQSIAHFARTVVD